MKNAKLLFADHFLEQEEEDVVLVEPTPVESLPPVEPTPEPSPQVITDQYEMMFAMVVIRLWCCCCSDIWIKSVSLQPTPEPKKPKSKKKTKIPIEDVEEVVEQVVAQPPAPEVVPVVEEEEEVVEKVGDGCERPLQRPQHAATPVAWRSQFGEGNILGRSL